MPVVKDGCLNKMETVKHCHLCNSENHHLLLQQSDLFLEDPSRRFSVRQCEACNLIFLSPRPDSNELMDFYPDSYIAYSKPLDEASKLDKINRAYGLWKRLKFVNRFVKKGRLLDVGCATGAFLEVVSESNQDWTLHGAEPSEYAAQVARQATNAEIYTGMLEDAHYPDNYFDAITLWDVLEHVFEPLETLQEIRRILKPEGVLVFSIPNIDSWDAAIFKHYWVGYDVPRHMHVFGDQTLARLLTQAQMYECGRACVAGSYFYFISSVLFYLRSTRPNHWLTDFAWRNHAAMPLRLISAPYFFISDKLVKGTTITVACRVN